MSADSGPRLVRSDPGVGAHARRRTILISMVIAAALLLGLVLWGLTPQQERGRAVVLASPAGSRVSLDGGPVPSLGSDGTYLLRLKPGGHDLAITLRGGQVIEHRVEVEQGEDALRLEVRYDRTFGRWFVLDVDAPASP